MNRLGCLVFTTLLFCNGGVYGRDCATPSKAVAIPPPVATAVVPAPRCVEQRVRLVPRTKIVDVVEETVEWIPKVTTRTVQKEIVEYVAETYEVEVNSVPCQQCVTSTQCVTSRRAAPINRLNDLLCAEKYLTKDVENMKANGSPRREVRVADRRLRRLGRRIDNYRRSQ